MCLVSDPPIYLLRCRCEAEDNPILLECFYVGLSQNDTATGRDNVVVQFRGFAHSFAFEISKSRFTVFLKDVRDASPGIPLNDVVCIDISHPKLRSQPSADRGLPSAHKTNKHNIGFSFK